ncbi:hypothetical protein ABN122_06775 [Enterobacter cloacae]
MPFKKRIHCQKGALNNKVKRPRSKFKAWSDRLAAAIELANLLPLKDAVSSIYVLYQQNRQRYTRDGFNSHWQQAKEEAQKKYSRLLVDFTFHV